MPPARNRDREAPVPSRVQPTREAKQKALTPKPAAKEAPTCSICLGKLSKKVTSIDCSHTFHQKCIKQWIDVPNRSCPNCRAPVTFMQCGKKNTEVEPIEEPLPHVRFLSGPRFSAAAGLDFGPRVWSPFAFPRSPSPTSEDDDLLRSEFLSFLAERAAAASDFSSVPIRIGFPQLHGGLVIVPASHVVAAISPDHPSP